MHVRGMHILQVLVPMGFLAIWALATLFNREAQPLPPRVGGRPPGPRPGGMPAARGMERRSAESLSRDASARWSSAGAGARPTLRPDDEIVILDPDSRRPTPASRPDSSPAARRSARARPSPPPPPRRQDLGTTRSLSGSMIQDAAPQLRKTLDISPLTRMEAPLATPVSQEMSAASPKLPPPLSATLPGLTSGEILGLINSPARLREAIVVNEILAPPLALRRGRRG